MSNSTETYASTGADVPPVRRYRRRLCLLGILAGLTVVLLIQREHLSAYPNSRARQSLAERDVETALGWLQISERLAPGNAEKEFLLARARRRQGRLEDMNACLDRARRRGWSPELIEREKALALAYSGKLREAEPTLLAACVDPRGDGPEICEALVTAYVKNWRIEDAIELLAVWEADFPSDPDPFFLRGLIRKEQRAWLDAAHEFQQALERDPGHVAATLEMADVLLELKRPDEALPYFDAAMKTDGNEHTARLGRALCLKMLGRHDEARDSLHGILDESPSDPRAAVELAQLEVNAGRHAGAVALLAPLAPREPYNLDLQYTFATALRGVGRREEAKTRFEAVSKIREQRRRASALVETISERPDDPDIRCEIGTIYLGSGLENDGLVWLSSALECDPYHEATHRALADYYARRSQDDPTLQSLAENHRRLSGESQP